MLDNFNRLKRHLFTLKILPVVLLFNLIGCQSATPTTSFEIYIESLETAYCNYFNTEASLAAMPLAYPILVLPDSLFWVNRQAFVQTNIPKLQAYTKLSDNERIHRDLWVNRLQLLDQQAISALLYFDLHEVFTHILQQEKLSPLEKIDFLNQKLSTYPAFLATAKTYLHQNDLPLLADFMASLSDTYFLLTKQIPQQVELHTPTPEIQTSLNEKIEAARLAVKDLLAYCRSFENNHLESL